MVVVLGAFVVAMLFFFLLFNLTLTKLLPNQCPALGCVTSIVIGKHAWNPKQAETKVVTLGTALGLVETLKSPSLIFPQHCFDGKTFADSFLLMLIPAKEASCTAAKLCNI